MVAVGVIVGLPGQQRAGAGPPDRATGLKPTGDRPDDLQMVVQARMDVLQVPPTRESELQGIARSFATAVLVAALALALVLAGAGLVSAGPGPRIAALGALGLAVLAGYQLHVHRLQPALLIAAGIAVVTILYRPFVSVTVLLGTTIGLAVAAAALLPLVAVRMRRSYLILLGGLWISQVIPASHEQELVGWQHLGERVLLMAIQLLLFVGVIVIIGRVAGALGLADRRYRHIYERVPISIWDEDFSEVGVWLADLRETGVDDLRAHLEANEQLIDHAIRLIRVKDVNPAAKRMLALGADVAVSERIDPATLTDETRSSFVDQLMAVWEGRDYATTNVVGQKVDGSRLDGILHWSAASSPGGLNLSEVIVAIDDVTESKAGDRAKAQFLANMSHELRTPLNAILGMAELCLGTTITPSQREYLSTIKTSVDALVTLVNDILDFSKLEAGRLRLTVIPFSLRDVVAETIATMHAAAARKGLELRYTVPASVPEGLLGDPGRLRQIFVNLIGNAIKFTHVGHVVVAVSVDGQQPGEVTLRFEVADTGIGIPPDDHDAVFRAFEQGDGSMTRRFGGTGLGLAITRELVDQMGGQIGLESAVGHGTTFAFTAKFGLADEDVMLGVPSMDEDFEGARVVVFGENPARLRTTAGMLRDGGLAPTAFEGGAAGLEAIGTVTGDDFGAVIADVDNEPLAVIEAVRARELPDHVPLIVVTGSGSRGDGALYSDLGVAAYLAHPLDAADLIDAVRAAMAAAQSGERLPLITRHWLRQHRRQLRVLVVDDSATNRLLATRLLEKRGHVPEAVENGQLAVAALADHDYDVVLMDIQMPQVDGLDATRLIREQEADTGARVPIVALTAHAREEDRDRCLAAGMDAYIAKPFNAHEVYSVIEQLARHAGPETRARVPQADAAMIEPDDEFWGLLVDAFVAGYETVRVALGEAVDARDFDEVAAASHRLKGEFGALGVPHAQEIAADLERSARDGDHDAVDDAWRRFRAVIDGEVVPGLRAADA